MPIGSLLKQVAKELPESFSMKAESVAPMLLKKGVKAEELKYADMILPKTGKVTKQQLVEAEGKRADKFYVTKMESPNYQSVNLPGGKDNPTYREKVLKFRRQGEADIDSSVPKRPWNSNIGDESRYTSAHFPEDDNYLMHTRVYDETLDGTETRVVAEIQSDLHQVGRQEGYNTSPLGRSFTIGEEVELDNLISSGQLEEAGELGRRAGWDGTGDIESWFVDTLGSPSAPTSPYEKTWLRKGIERELSDAVDEGRAQLAIPISGKVNELSRAPGVQKWYETQVVNTAKKVAKQSGGTFELKTVGGKSVDLGLNEEDLVQIRSIYDKEGVFSKQNGWEAAINYVYRKIGAPADITVPDLVSSALDGKNIDDLTKQFSDEGVTYAVIKPSSKEVRVKGEDVGLIPGETYGTGKSEPLNFTLYSSPAAGAFVAYQAYKAGMTEEQVNAKLTADYGYDAEDIDEVARRVNVITQSIAAGMSMDDIKAKMQGMEPTADTVASEPPTFRSKRKSGQGGRFRSNTPKQSKFDTLVDDTEQMTAEELVSSMKVLHPTMVSDTITTIPAYFGNKEAKQRYDQAREASRSRIISLAKEDYNLDLLWQANEVGSEGWFAQTPEGLVEVTPGWLEDFKKVSGEIAGGIGGAIIGGKRGASAGAALALTLGQMGPQVALPEELATVPLFSAIGGVTGAVVGGWLGAVSGSQLDYMIQAIKLQEDFESEAMAYRAFNAFEAAAIGEAIGYPLIKGVGTSWSAIVRAKDAIMGGEAKAAYQSLKDTTFLTDDQITGIVQQLEKHATLSGNKYEKGVKAVALTEPGMQDLVRAAGATHPKASSATAHVVQSRAEDVLTQTAKLTDEQVPRMLAVDLQNYTGDVKDQYARVKAKATQSPRGLDFEWDFEELAIKPVMEELRGKITDPVTRQKFILQMRRVNTMSESRSFGDLLELRQMTNDFLYNKRITKADDKATLRGIINNIDSAIEEGAPHVLEQPDKWLKDWSQARIDYSKMKQIEKTAMYRAIFNKDGSMRAVQPETVVRALGRHITSIDGSFEEIMTKLPIEGRKMYEGAVVDALTNRFTAGVDKGSKAIHFPMLADELKKINFTTPGARATKKALIELGETFKNDVALAVVGGQVTKPKFAQGLSADLVVKAKYATASNVYTYIKSRMPGEEGRSAALLRSVQKLLEKPLDAQNFKTLQAEVFDDANLSKQILNLQQEAARNRMKEVEVGTPKVKIYSGGKLKGTGNSTTIPMHRILTLQQAKEIAEAEALTLDSKALDAVLKQYGYKAILQGSDRVRILGDK